jgi:hypothetical protein
MRASAPRERSQPVCGGFVACLCRACWRQAFDRDGIAGRDAHQRRHGATAKHPDGSAVDADVETDIDTGVDTHVSTDLSTDLGTVLGTDLDTDAPAAGDNGRKLPSR